MISKLTLQEASWHPATLLNVEETQCYSAITRQNYRIQVAKIGYCPPNGYPVMYLLDGDFSLPLAMLLYQSVCIYPEDKAGILLVGVGYSNDHFYAKDARAKDYLPHQMASSTDGAEHFYQYIIQTLKPLVEQRHTIDTTHQTLFGHSFGGVFALHTLFNHTSAFHHYVISSPSIWWNHQKVLQDEYKLSQPPHSIRLSSAEYEERPCPQDSDARIAKKEQRQMVSNNQALYTRLSARFPNDDIELHIYPKESHASIIPHVLMDTLKAYRGF